MSELASEYLMRKVGLYRGWVGAGSRGEALSMLPHASRRSRVYKPLQNVEFSAIYKDSTNPTDGGTKPISWALGLRPGQCLSIAFAKRLAFLPLLACADPRFTELEVQSADLARAKPVCACFAGAPPDPQAGRAWRQLRCRPGFAPYPPPFPP